MPIHDKQWSDATKYHIKKNVPEKAGVYELRSFGELKYIGKAKNLRRRLREHLNDTNPNKYRFEIVTGFFSSAKSREDELLDWYEDKHGELPPWNSNDTRNNSGLF